jgi:lysozyme family protein
VTTPFDRALERTLGFEGGTSDSAIDRGGFTFRGITQGLYDRWRRRKGLTPNGVAFITDSEIRAIAREEFWDPCRCSDLPDRVAGVVFDFAFNSGPSDAIEALQRGLAVKVDGVVGEKTIAAARAAGDRAALLTLKGRMAHIQEVIADDPPQLGNLEGWGNRMLDLAWAP